MKPGISFYELGFIKGIKLYKGIDRAREGLVGCTVKLREHLQGRPVAAAWKEKSK